MKRKFMRKFLACFLSVTLVACSILFQNNLVSAATKPTKITLSSSSKILYTGEKYQIVISKVTPAHASEKVKYSSSNKKIAMVSKKGVVTAMKKGTAVITVTSSLNKKVKASCKIKVKKGISNQSITFNETSASLYIGETKTLSVSWTPANTKVQKVTWSSSAEEVATVTSEGTVTAKAAGTAVITAVNTYGKKATCTVTVLAKSEATSTPTSSSATATPTVTATAVPTATVAPTVTPGFPGPGGPTPPGGSGGPGGTGGSGDSSTVETKGTLTVTDTQTFTNTANYNSSTADVSPIVVNGGNLTLENATITKTGDTSSADNSNFYGLNAGLLAKAAGTITISGSSITTNSEGSNAVFSTGTNSKINLSDVTINTSSNSSRGLDATYGGTIIGDNVSITTQGAHCAALATDRGEGTVTVTNSTLNTAGTGSPCIYSTGTITATNTKGKATGSSLGVVEGKNSITLNNSDIEGYAKGRTDSGVDSTGIMIYQSTSGDASEGTGTFTANDSKLTISSASSVYTTAPMFFATNTDAVFDLKNTELSFGSGILLSAAGNSGEWGTAGSNGANVTVNAENQTLNGNITADGISTILLNLVNSDLTSTVNTTNSAKSVSINLDKDSIWNVTGTSYVTILTNADSTCSNIISNGNTIYYDSSNNANSWLNGATISLSGGGTLTPAK